MLFLVVRTVIFCCSRAVFCVGPWVVWIFEGVFSSLLGAFFGGFFGGFLFCGAPKHFYKTTGKTTKKSTVSF